MNNKPTIADPVVRRWVKQYGKQKEGFYKTRYPYIILKRILDDIKRMPKDYYIYEDQWITFCTAAFKEGYPWLRNMVSQDNDLMKLVANHLDEEKEKALKEKMVLPTPVSPERQAALLSKIRS